MNHNNLSQSRANEVWKRLVGMFGGDAVERKYGATPPVEWSAMMGRLKDYEVDRGIRRLAYSGKAHVPSLPEFTKLCRTVGDDGLDEGPTRPALPAPETFAEGWEIAANTHFLGYVRRRLSESPRAWGEPFSPEQKQATLIAVKHKAASTTAMREYGSMPSPEYQRAAWEACMERAESEIASAR